ncbi:MAG TPA: tRNA (adenosine(37)-N6)-threonylcarbamoyltransferase complex dimerization subunit type 1 TsaB [Bacteroidetes bacterium]|nr:tRNA (adenosine(37)-N6)-threonylcarbamoyltransferase complex dimerization subunit type 1 TsaB [Bacteroidota bacterium]
MSYLLHIETTTDVCSVGISEDDKLISLSETNNSLRHSEIITLQIEEVIKKANINKHQLDAVSFSEGPGSYTSLRVGLSAAKALCYALDLPLISVNTLFSLANASKNKIVADDYIYCSMIDARRMEVYASIYKNNNPVIENTPLILDKNSFDEYKTNAEKIVLSGNGSLKCKAIFNSEDFIYSDIFCSSRNLISPAFERYQMKIFEDIAYFSPNYIKPPNITTPKK